MRDFVDAGKTKHGVYDDQHAAAVQVDFVEGTEVAA
jgi:hypothetical protein